MSDANIKDKILESVKSAMRSQQKERLATLRLITASLKQREVDDRITLTDEQTTDILNKLIKQRRESIKQYIAGNRPELAEKEQQEITLIQEFLPAQLSSEQIDQAILDAIKSSEASSAKDMGKVMGILKAKIDGRADMTLVSTKVKERLAQ